MALKASDKFNLQYKVLLMGKRLSYIFYVAIFTALNLISQPKFSKLTIISCPLLRFNFKNTIDSPFKNKMG